MAAGIAIFGTTLTDAALTIMVGTMAHETTIDQAGRIVIPKRLRDRMNLGPGKRPKLFEKAGCLIITPDGPEPRLVDRDGFLALDLGTEASVVYATRLGSMDLKISAIAISRMQPFCPGTLPISAGSRDRGLDARRIVSVPSTQFIRASRPARSRGPLATRESASWSIMFCAVDLQPRGDQA